MAKSYRPVAEVLATPHTVVADNTFALLRGMGIPNVPSTHDKRAEEFLRDVRKYRAKLRAGGGTEDQRGLWAYWRASAAVNARAALAVSRRMRKG